MLKSKQVDSSIEDRLTLGFLTYHDDNDNHNQIMAGIFTAAQKHAINIIQFCGFSRGLGNEGLHREIKTLLKNINQQNLDGLMFIGWIPNFVQSFQEDINQLQMPIFSIGAGFENIPNVHTDGGIYLRELFIHLVQVHCCSKIAFVSPMINSPFINDNRLQVYTDVMQKFGIYDPRLLVNAAELIPIGSDFYLRGQKALDVLIDERKVAFDAIFSAFNEETNGILKGLKKRQIRVPHDVKVISYEDNDTNKYASIPITTVYFPFWELGFYGCERFVEILTNKNHQVPLSNFIPGKTILRNSCGCISKSVNLAVTAPLISGESSPRESSPRESSPRKSSFQPVRLNQQQIYKQMQQEFPNPIFDLTGLIKVFFTDFKMKTNLNFFSALEDQTAIYYQNRADVAGMEDFISQLRKLILPYFKPDARTQCQNSDFIWTDDLFHQARIIIAEKLANLMGHQKVQNDYLNQTLHKISHELITTFNTQKLMDVLELSLPCIDIPGCYIFLFTRESTSLNDATLVFKYVDERRISLKASHPFSLRDLKRDLTQGQRFSLVAYPLSVKSEYLGLVFFEPGPLDERIYFTLSVLLSTALKEAILVEKLENINQELKTAQQELVDKAHKAGMADIATGTLHNIGNVLNSINTSIYVMRDIVYDSPFKDFERANHILKNNMENLEKFFINDPRGPKLLQLYLKLEKPFHELQNQISEHLDRLVDRIVLANEIIIAQQNYAGARPILEELDITNVIEDALKLQLTMLQKYKIKIITNFNPLPKIVVQRTKLLHILVNLFNNAKDAMKETPEAERSLMLTLDGNENNTYLRITDTGHGIPPELIRSIFAQGVTTKPEGHGFGLHSCANYMTEMGGKIWAESPGVGNGATFILQFHHYR